MPKRSDGLRIGLRLSASAALLALAFHAGVAQDAGAGAHDDGLSHPSEHANDSRGAGGDSVGGDTNTPQNAFERADVKKPDGAAPSIQSVPRTTDANPSASATKTKPADDIDTRIGIQPQRTNAKPGHIGDNKTIIESAVTRNLHRRMFLASRPSNDAVRNAIGVPIPQHERMDHHEYSGSIAVPHNFAVTTGGAESAGGHVTRGEGHIDHLMANPNPLAGSTVPSRGAINGTSLVRRGPSPSQIGGPKASVGGINGTTIRPKP
jgi:hypothetical protein